MSYREQITNMITKVERAAGRRDSKQQELATQQQELNALLKEIELYEQVQVIIQTVANETQQQLRFHIENIVNLALQAVFQEQPYQFKINFSSNGKGQTEAEITLERDGNSVHPISACGGGVVDVVSFALRLAVWSLAGTRTRALFILDEPFKFLSRNLIGRAADILRQLSQRLGLQIIMVTHVQEIADHADKTFLVVQRKGVSSVLDSEKKVTITEVPITQMKMLTPRRRRSK